MREVTSSLNNRSPHPIFLTSDYSAVPNTRNVTHIHLRSLSTNTPHPDAFVPRLDSDAPNYLNSAFIQIVDDVVGLFVRSQQVVQLQIWNWRTGATLVVRYTTPLRLV
jgi:hypothetical protein